MIGADFGDVLSRAQQGDAASVERIYREYAPLVLGVLRSNRVYDADDVASEVFVSMIRALGRFQGEEAGFRSWLLTITHRRTVDAIRRDTARRDEATDQGELAAVAGGAGDAEHAALQRLESQGILAALEALTPDQRAVLSLRILADQTVPEIARIVDKPETAVKALLQRGLASLRRQTAGAVEAPDPRARLLRAPPGGP